MFASYVDPRETLAAFDVEQVQLVRLLDRTEILRTALRMLISGTSGVAWVAEPSTGHGLELRHVVGDRTGALRGLCVPDGLGLTGKVHSSSAPEWVNDYFAADSITHNFDRPVHDEGIARLLAVPMMTDGGVSGVLAFGDRGLGEFGDRLIEHVAAVAEQARVAREVAIANERRRMAADMHDSVGALLYAIGSGVAGLAAAPAALDPDVAASLRRLQGLPAEAITALRDSLRMLHTSPSALALGVTIRADCLAFFDRTGVPAELIILDADPPQLPPSKTAVLVAGVREALLNIEKHASAAAVVVTTSFRGDMVTVAVTDDGAGLGTAHRPGIGLTSTEEAFARLGGSLNVMSDLTGGTTWRGRLPC
jgi:signal transduction histidine kinase